MTEKLLTATIERGMPSDYEIVFERESEQSPVRRLRTPRDRFAPFTLTCASVLPV
jgi:hypothetical protein